MKPTDLRDATWAEVQTHFGDDLVRVYEAWKKHGPATTRSLAGLSGISLLTLRPRTTDLYQIGLVALVDRDGVEGIYEFRQAEEAEAAWMARTSPVFEIVAKSKSRATLPMSPASRPPAASVVGGRPTKAQLKWASSILNAARHAARRSDPAQLELLAS